MHKVDDDTIVTPALLRAFIRIAEEEGNNGQHYAVIQQMDGGFLDHNPHSPELEPMQAIFARDVITMLNKELHHDGVWLIVFTAPGALAHMLQSVNEYTRFTVMWLDKDGDLHIRIEWVAGETDELDFADVLESGLESWGERCEQAWQMWNMMTHQVLEAERQKTVMLAKGEQTTTQH